MSDEADNTQGMPEDSGVPEGPTAGPSEPMIPKHRFDEVAGQLREQRAELQLLKEMLNRTQAPQPQQQAPSINFEQYGLDENTGRAFMEVAKHTVKTEMAQDFQSLKQQIGFQQNHIEELAFLNKYGHDKEDLLPLIRQKKQEYAQKYRSYLPTEDAFLLVTGMRTRAVKKTQPVNQPTPPVTQTGNPAQPQGGYPDPALTRTQTGPSGGAPAANRSFDELTVEEMEAQIDEQIQNGRLRI